MQQKTRVVKEAEGGWSTNGISLKGGRIWTNWVWFYVPNLEKQRERWVVKSESAKLTLQTKYTGREYKRGSNDWNFTIPGGVINTSQHSSFLKSCFYLPTLFFYILCIFLSLNYMSTYTSYLHIIYLNIFIYSHSQCSGGEENSNYLYFDLILMTIIF